MKPNKVKTVIPWIERKFDFTCPAGMFPEVLERVRGTSARVVVAEHDDHHLATMTAIAGEWESTPSPLRFGVARC